MSRPRFPLFVDLSDTPVLVVGAGKIASRRIRTLADFAGNITVVAPEIAPEAEKLPARLCRRTFEEADLNGMGLVVAATDDDALNARIAALCRERKIPVNVSTDHTLCDFYFPGVARKGELVAGVTAGGTDHRAARELTERIRELRKGD